MSSLLAKVIDNRIYRMLSPPQPWLEESPSEIPTLKGYTAQLMDARWLHLRAKRKRA